MNANEYISGERLFLLYAYPCVESREHRGLIRRDDVDRLNGIVKGGEVPSHELLGRCFPNAVRLFRESINLSPSHSGPWSTVDVRKYWRMHKGEEPSCSVMCGHVDHASIISARVFCADKLVTILNPYGLPVCVGDLVYFHRSVIVEVEKY